MSMIKVLGIAALVSVMAALYVVVRPAPAQRRMPEFATAPAEAAIAVEKGPFVAVPPPELGDAGIAWLQPTPGDD
jgi:hypothetical protein